MSYPTGYCQLAKVDGDKINVTHSAQVSAWTPVFINGRYFIPIATVAASTESAGYVKGIFRFAITNGVTLAAGDRVYLNEASSAYRVQSAKPTTGYLIGTVVIGGTGNSAGTVEAYVDINETSSDGGDFGSSDVATTGKVFQAFANTVVTADGNEVMTVAELVGGSVLFDCGGANRNYTTLTAAQIVAAFDNPKVGAGTHFFIKNTSDDAETITVVGGTNVTVTGTATIAQNYSKQFMLVFTNVTSGSEAVTLQSMGALLH